MKWGVILAATGASIPPLWLVIQNANISCIRVDWIATAIGGIFFVACLCCLIAMAIYESGEV